MNRKGFLYYFYHTMRMHVRDFLLMRKFGPETLEGQVLRNGIVVIPDYFSADEMRFMMAGLDGRNDYIPNPQGTKTHMLEEADKIPSLKPFFEHPVLTRVMRNLIGPKAMPLRCVVHKKTFHGLTGGFDQRFHSDIWRYRYKFWLYLNDVTEENGPFTYVPRTVRGWRKFFFDYEHFKNVVSQPVNIVTDEKSVYAGTMMPEEAEAFFKRVGAKPEAVTGKAGTLIIWDARGLHRATPLKKGTRLHVESYWIEEGHHT